MKHSINRTSPKGQDFVGTCSLCGKEGLKLTTKDMNEECPNVRGLTANEALIEAVTGDVK